MPLHRALAPQDIVLNARSRSVGAVLALIAGRAARGDAPLQARIARRLGEQQDRGRVAVLNGVALPHAAVNGVLRPRAVFVQMERPLLFGAAGDEPVHAVLALLVPRPAFQSDYDVLMHCTELLRRPAVVRQLSEAADAPSVHRLLAGAAVPA